MSRSDRKRAGGALFWVRSLYTLGGEPGVISAPFEGCSPPAVSLAFTGELPVGFPVWLVLISTARYVASIGDSMDDRISRVVAGTVDPPTPVQVFPGEIVTVVAMFRVSFGFDGVSASQYFVAATAIPVWLVLLPSLRVTPRMDRELAQRSQN